MILYKIYRFELEIFQTGGFSRKTNADYQQVTESIHAILGHLKI